MTDYAYDAATFQPGEITASDCLFACCYTDGSHAYSPPTIAEIRAAGKGILANHENAQTELSGGSSAGVQAASHAVAAVLSWGMPQDGSCAIHYSVDASVPASQFSIYAAAFAGIRSVHGGRFLVGFYGELALYDYLLARGLVDVKCWLSASSSFPGYNPASDHVGLVQQVGSDIPETDRNLITDADTLGVWMAQVDLTPAAVEAVRQAIWETATIPVWGDNSQPAQPPYFALAKAAGTYDKPIATPEQIDAMATAVVAAIGQPATKADVVAALSSTTLTVGAPA